MKASWLVRVFIGIMGFILTFGFTLINNLWATSLFRAVIGFFIFILLGELLRVAFRFIGLIKTSPHNPEQNMLNSGRTELGEVGMSERASNEEPEFHSISLEALHHLMEKE